MNLEIVLREGCFFKRFLYKNVEMLILIDKCVYYRNVEDIKKWGNVVFLSIYDFFVINFKYVEWDEIIDKNLK